jgi:hypothetical protein
MFKLHLEYGSLFMIFCDVMGEAFQCVSPPFKEFYCTSRSIHVSGNLVLSRTGGLIH